MKTKKSLLSDNDDDDVDDDTDGASTIHNSHKQMKCTETHTDGWMDG